MMEADPFEAVIALAAADAGLAAITGGRVDMLHRYGQDVNDWPLNAQALTLTPATGAVPELNDPVQNLALAARCYGDTPLEAGQVYMKLVDWLRASAIKRTVAVTGGTALVYFVQPVSSPALGLDDEIRPGGGMPFLGIQLQAQVSELFVP